MAARYADEGWDARTGHSRRAGLRRDPAGACPHNVAVYRFRCVPCEQLTPKHMRRYALLPLCLALVACSSTSQPGSRADGELKVRTVHIPAMEEQSVELAVDGRVPATADITRIFLAYMGGTGSDGETGRTKEAAEDLATEILTKARAGEDFQKLLATYTDDADKTGGTKKDVEFEEAPVRASAQPISDAIAKTDEGGYFGPIDLYGVIQVGRVDRKELSRVGLDVDDPGMLLRLEGKEYKLARRDGTKYMFANVAVPNVGKNNAKIVLSSGPTIPFEVHRDAKTPDEWRKYAEDADYQRLLRNPISMTGKPVKLRGTLIQFQEIARDLGWGGIDMWDSSVRQQTGFVYFDLEGTTSVDVGRRVMLYGFAQGTQAMEMSDGGTRLTPMIDAYFIEAM